MDSELLSMLKTASLMSAPHLNPYLTCHMEQKEWWNEKRDERESEGDCVSLFDFWTFDKSQQMTSKYLSTKKKKREREWKKACLIHDWFFWSFFLLLSFIRGSWGTSKHVVLVRTHLKEGAHTDILQLSASKHLTQLWAKKRRFEMPVQFNSISQFMIS